MVIRGLRNIGLHMGVSGMTILRWHRRYKDPTLCFPLVPIGTGIGNSTNYITSNELVNEWMWRLSGENVVKQRMEIRSHVRMSMCRMASKGSAGREGS